MSNRFRTIVRRILRRERVAPDVALFDDFELCANADGTLTIRPQHASLCGLVLQRLATRLVANGLQAFTMVVLDCSKVSEFTGPWGVHVAVCWWLRKKTGIQFRFTGLSGQPGAIVALWGPHNCAIWRRSPTGIDTHPIAGGPRFG